MDNFERVTELRALSERIDAVALELSGLRDEMRAFVDAGEQDQERADQLHARIHKLLAERNAAVRRLAELDPALAAGWN